MMAARGQTYGKAGQQMEAQRAVPMRKPPTEQKFARPMPAGSLFAPTARPNEPITAGAPFGAGVGPEALGVPMMPNVMDESVRELRMIAQSFPNTELSDLLDAYESQ